MSHSRSRARLTSPTQNTLERTLLFPLFRADKRSIEYIEDSHPPVSPCPPSGFHVERKPLMTTYTSPPGLFLSQQTCTPPVTPVTTHNLAPKNKYPYHISGHVHTHIPNIPNIPNIPTTTTITKMDVPTVPMSQPLPTSPTYVSQLSQVSQCPNHRLE